MYFVKKMLQFQFVKPLPAIDKLRAGYSDLALFCFRGAIEEREGVRRPLAYRVALMPLLPLSYYPIGWGLSIDHNESVAFDETLLKFRSNFPRLGSF
jgi:hypothetical protein